MTLIEKICSILLVVAISLIIIGFGIKINDSIHERAAIATVTTGVIRYKDYIPEHTVTEWTGRFYYSHTVPDLYTYTVVGQDSHGELRFLTFETTKDGYERIRVGSNWTRPAN